MSNDALPEEWEIIRNWLPADLDDRARQHEFIQRDRGLADAERWLRLILMHVAGGLSLEQTVLRARELHLASVSSVALFKRLRRAEPWLQDLCQYLMAGQQERLGRCLWPGQYRVRVIDATDIQEPGHTGSCWRLHYSIGLPDLACNHYELTDQQGGEGLGRFQFQEGELILADRGYSRAAGVVQVLESGADLLLRWHSTALPLQDPQGRALDVLQRVRGLVKHTAQDWNVQFFYQGKVHRLRLCALRKSQLATERARRKAQIHAHSEGHQIRPETLELAGYILVLTTLPSAFSASQVLSFYRCRWQVELAFKRLKSLLAAGHVPKSNDQSARAWMQAKILTALLLDRLLLEAKIFSPWGYRLPELEPVARRRRSA